MVIHANLLILSVVKILCLEIQDGDSDIFKFKFNLNGVWVIVYGCVEMLMIHHFEMRMQPDMLGFEWSVFARLIRILDTQTHWYADHATWNIGYSR